MQQEHGRQDEIRAELCISGFENLEEIESLIPTLKPTEVLRKGEPKRLGERRISSTLKYKKNIWIWRTKELTSEIEVQLQMLLNELWPLRSQISKLETNYDVGISIHGYVYHSQVAVNLDAKTLKRIGDLNLTLDIDIYSVSA